MPYEWEEWGLWSLVGIEPYEVRQVLDGKVRWPRAAVDPSTSLRTLMIYGRPAVGRPLVVGDAVSDKQGLPETPEEARELMSRLVPEPPPTPEEEADLLAALPPPGSEVMVVRSLRIPLEMDEAVSQAAQANAVPKSTWIRQAIEMALAVQAEEDQPISRADALRALTLLRPIRRVA